MRRLSLEAARAKLRRARFSATPIDAWPILIGTKLVQTQSGRRVVDAVQRRAATAHRPESVVPPTQMRRPSGRNVLFVSHCDFTGNSAFHVYAMATELERLGWSPAIAVPRNARGVRDLGKPGFHVLTYKDAHRGQVRFPDGEGADLVHAFTPREHVRNLTLSLAGRHRCPYVLHLEDSEIAVQDAVVGGYDATSASGFVEGAVGMSVVIDRLLEFKPVSIPGVVVWPGYDEAIDRPGRARDDIREDIGLAPNEVAVVYPGNVHEVNLDEIASLYEAIGALRRSRPEVVLVKSGWNRVEPARLPRMGRGIRDLGWISRRRVPELLRAADILVQPGSPGAFNDYRFPSKLPEFLASGQPVVLPRTNIGLHLRDGVDAMILERGDADEMEEKVAILAEDPELRLRLGAGGRAFAVRELQWRTNVRAVAGLYEGIGGLS